jgi:hypothetical protein
LFAGQWWRYSGKKKSIKTLLYPDELIKLDEQYICLKRADNWDFTDIQQWQASKIGSIDKGCKSNEVECGSGAFAYCVNQSTFSSNGNTCPIQKISVVAPAAD